VGFLKNIKIKLIHPDAKIPAKATASSSGFDIYSYEDHLLKKNSYSLISTGVIFEMENGMEAQVRPRSGLAVKNGITVLNSPGTIDSDYRGEVKVALINHSDEDFAITKGMRIAQIVFSTVIDVELNLSDEVNTTQRNSGGFGSTGLH
jgi:dUTP pyrophosphatase